MSNGSSFELQALKTAEGAFSTDEMEECLLPTHSKSMSHRIEMQQSNGLTSQSHGKLLHS